MKEPDALAALSALANATRLRILKTLVAAGTDGLTAGDVARHVDASPSRASFHLAALSETGLISSVRRSREITYRVDFARIGDLIRYLMQDCCANNAIVRACCLPEGEGR